MSMKNYLIKWKFLLYTIIYSILCIIFIRNFASFNIETFNNPEKNNSEGIVRVTPLYATTLSNKLPYNTSRSTKDGQPPNLSRGNNEDLDRDPTIDNSKTYNKDDELYILNETALLDSYYEKKASVNSTSIINKKNNQVINAHLPDDLMYKNVNITDLKEFLQSKNSLLVEEPYFSTIISVSKDFNLNPLVMFAITGQEQSFVPKTDKNAHEIANNPFNVFYSWKHYNTDIQDATSIAARTIINLCKNRPNNIDAFTWVNRKYSEDKNWSKAIRSIFSQLESNVSYWK